jgi:hypothetical protein
MFFQRAAYTNKSETIIDVDDKITVQPAHFGHAVTASSFHSLMSSSCS